MSGKITQAELREAIDQCPVRDGVVYGQFDKRPLAPFIFEEAGLAVPEKQRAAAAADMRRGSLRTAHHVLMQAIAEEDRREEHAAMFATLIEVAGLTVTVDDDGAIRIS